LFYFKLQTSNFELRYSVFNILFWNPYLSSRVYFSPKMPPLPKLHFNQHRRYADLPLHYGQVPQWLAQRMSALGGAIVEAILIDYGKEAFLKKLSDPFWF
jgi:hypothetical protein